MADKFISASALRKQLGIDPDGDCEKCRFRGMFGCQQSGDFVRACTAIDDCPSILPEKHGRLGDLDALEDAFIRYYLGQERQNHLVFTPVEIKQHFADMIGDWPTIIEAEGE